METGKLDRAEKEGMGNQTRSRQQLAIGLDWHKLSGRVWDLLLVLIMVLHVWMAPYTKVEESFNIQAMHDLLYHRHHLNKYDHLEFSGVVPRTFIGAIIVSLLSYPLVLVAVMQDLPKLYSLIIVRLVLGCLVLTTLFILRLQIHKKFGQQVSFAYTLVTILQFHLLFYATRPLPNVFALAVVNLAYAYWITGKPGTALSYLVFAAIVFRCDVILLLGPIGLSLLMRKQINILSAIRKCFVTSLLSIVLTVSVDSVFWRRWLWPEMEVFWFNSILNRSSEWGVSPMHWYFTSALPRAMLASFPLCFLGLALERRLAEYVVPVFVFVILYSKLAHKELRFILFALPILNLSAAVAIVRIYNNRKKPFWAALFLGSIFMLMASAGIVGIISGASYANYPGGKALELLHTKDTSTNTAQRAVHIDVLPAMTGVSRFCEKGPPWRYSKEEGLSVEDLLAKNFTYLVSAQPNVTGFKCLIAVEGFSRLDFQYSSLQISMVLEPHVFIHGNKGSMLVNDQQWDGCKPK